MVVARTHAQGTRKRLRQMVRRLFERSDSNTEQFLTAPELGYGGVGEFFNLRDADHNGQISLVEWVVESNIIRRTLSPDLGPPFFASCPKQLNRGAR